MRNLKTCHLYSVAVLSLTQNSLASRLPSLAAGRHPPLKPCPPPPTHTRSCEVPRAAGWFRSAKAGKSHLLLVLQENSLSPNKHTSLIPNAMSGWKNNYKVMRKSVGECVILVLPRFWGNAVLILHWPPNLLHGRTHSECAMNPDNGINILESLELRLWGPICKRWCRQTWKLHLVPFFKFLLLVKTSAVFHFGFSATV